MSIPGHATVRPVPLVLIATDADAVADEVAAAIEDEGTSVLRVRAGADVPGAVGEHEPDLVVLDLQIGNMGGMAVAQHLRAEADMGRLPDTAVLMLLDRAADVFLAKRSDADGWNTSGELNAATYIRARYMITLVRDELVEAALSNTGDVTLDQLE